jgi:hypothetical protein
MDVFNKKDSEYGVVYTDLLRVFEDNTTQYLHAPLVKYKKLLNEDMTEYQTFGLGLPSAVIRRVCFVKAGMFDENLPRFIDLELFIRLANLYRFYRIKEPLGKHYKTPAFHLIIMLCS